ncbi:hypothetical protein ACT2FY_36640 [Paraburkholderia fungorum]|uniref:hypothetical protein n=1 Tax=Paraburkholderia fungorum TaxID=134537 RepID=UPI00402B6A81
MTGKQTSGAFTNPMLTLAGRCGSATITRQNDSASLRPAAVAFYTNGFKTFIELKAESEHESVTMFGHMLWDKHEPPTAGKVVLIDKSGVPSKNWFDEAAASLRHIARVMSLATDVYIEPRVVHEQRGDADVFSVDGTVPSPQPHIAPFETVHLDVVFKHAVAMTKDDRKTFEEFDLPIRWLIAPAHYDEARHIGAMTALEAILSNASLEETLLEKTPFENLRKKLSKVIKEEGLHPDLVKLMCRKLPDLNRPALRDKLEIYLDKHDVPTGDFPPEVFGSVIAARNQVVHRGIGRDRHADIGPFMYISRALVTRMILRAAKYHGPLRWANGEGFKHVSL